MPDLRDLLPPPPWEGPPIPRGLARNPKLRYEDVAIGDIVNIRTWIPRRADLRNYVVVGKPMGKGYEGLIIRKDPRFGGTTATMYIPGVTITKIEVVG